MDAPITKKLIISGLTPSISVQDISRRLTTFGSVKAVDGFGLLDGVGRPRKFGYVTLETTVGKLSKCMNLLSGSTWKGAKLRFGEAKPDFRERLLIESEKEKEERPKKKRRRYGAVYAEDMSLVTPENASQRPGWRVSPLGRITCPVKMRPSHPLIQLQDKKSSLKDEAKSSGKRKKRLKNPDNRARRQMIDMTKYGSTHLKGIFLDLEVPLSSQKKSPYEPTIPAEEQEEESESEKEKENNFIPVAESSKAFSEFQKLGELSNIPLASLLSSPDKPPLESFVAEENNVDLHREKAANLNLLKSLFDANDDSDWDGQESARSDVGPDELIKGDIMPVDENTTGFEVVPKDSSNVATSMEVDDDGQGDAMDMDSSKSIQPTSERAVRQSMLKRMFAPREEEAGFSLLGHLDLEDDFDNEIPFTVEEISQSQQPPHQLMDAQITSSSAPIVLQTQPYQAPLVLNPKQALFFPLDRQSGSGFKARQRDVYDIVTENGWNWRDPAVAFYRTQTEDEIQKRWEDSKGELTKEWKRRWREAGKVNRRKGGVEGNDY